MSIRILLADDHKLVCKALGTALDRAPDMVVVGLAYDGREAIELAKQVKPDVVVMDYAMPNANGAAATELIIDACPSAKVVIISGFFDSKIVNSALKAGARGIKICCAEVFPISDRWEHMARSRC